MADGEPESIPVPPGEKCQCTVCSAARYDTYEEAEEHERRCQVAAFDLKYQEGRRLGLLIQKINGPIPSVRIGRGSVLFVFVKQIRADATVLCLPHTYVGSQMYDYWRSMDDEELDRIVNIALSYVPTTNIRNCTVSLDVMNSECLKAALRGWIRPRDIITKVNATTQKDWGSSPDTFVAALLTSPESYPVTLTLRRQVEVDSDDSTESQDTLDLSNNMFIKNGDWGRLNGIAQIQPSIWKLCLDRNNIGHTGCEVISNLLARRDSVLWHLSLRENLLDNDCMAMIVEALKGNDKVELLDVSDNAITETIGKELVLNLVLNKTSINSTFTSNHTLRRLDGFGDLSGRDKLSRMLHVNRVDAHPAFEKTWRIHFKDERFDLQELLSVDVMLMPRVLAWFACKERIGNLTQLKRLYRIIRNWNIPELFGFPSAESVRIGSRLAELEAENRLLRAKLDRFEANGGVDSASLPKRKRLE